MNASDLGYIGRAAEGANDSRSGFHGYKCSATRTPGEVAILERAECSGLGYVQPMLDQWLSGLLEDRGMSQAELSRRLTAELGRSIDRAAVNKMTKGKRNIDGDEVLAIERILGAAAPRDMPTTAPSPSTVPAIPGRDLVGGVDLPVYAAAQGGEGHLIVSFEAVEYVKRPEPLRHVTDGYGLLVTGESMVPAFRPGDTALINPRLPPERDQDVILYHNPPDGTAEATIKHLVGFNDREWTLEQFNPLREFRLARPEWPVCHRVVGKYSRR